MVRLAHFLAASLAALGASASNVVSLVPDTFDDVVLKSGTPALVEFFAPWCGHCKKLAPIYEELADGLAFAKNKLTVAKVDADAEKSLGVRFGINGFPTLMWFDGKNDTPEEYNGARDFDSLAAFVTEKSGVKPKVKKGAASPVQMLTDQTFAEQIGKDRDAIVAFTAPWCGHCKALAPVWEKVAADYASDAGILIAKVDCEAENAKATAKAAGVSGYPTLMYYPKGSTEGTKYSGGRTEEDLLSFLNEQTGLHRAVGGGLDALAGVIPSLDDLLANLKSGGDAAYRELEKAAGALSDTSAQYYAKVAAKMEATPGYVEKELARLQGLLAKGGLAPAKSDDLTTRSNILSRFLHGAPLVKDEL